MTESEQMAAGLAMVTAARAGDPQAAADIAMAVTDTKPDAIAAMGFLVGLARGLLEMLAAHGDDLDAVLSLLGMRIAQGSQ